jgi:superfamily I DNA/RNA helicase
MALTDGGCVVLSTVHKAKGLEWERVFMLKHTFGRWEGREEDNIMYVAITRSKSALMMVEE